ncbi:MAG TPA: tetratricopeptide repeat protein, partial [Fimbriimonas sp.]|nr:tetratricopeptide repeat protein [Fimbriimonas sp.]
MPDIAMPLPTGTVTFLFSDIEGSTRMWEEHPVAMRSGLATHDALIRAAIEQNGGHVFKTIGDAFCAAFQDAWQSLEAAVAAQQALVEETWPASLTLRVRMALHTGSVEARDGDYFGQPLNRSARMLASAHGGQVLCSQATYNLVKGLLSGSTSLRDLGERRLKDLVHPERIYQLDAPKLRKDFPPLRTLDDHAHNLPVQLTSFVGREREMDEVRDLVRESKMVTLLGAGGCGKTRLALQTGADLAEEFAGGVWLVELASVSEGRLVPQAVESALGLKEAAEESSLDTLQRFCKPKELLLVLDNCEHLVDACAGLCQSLLTSCPNLKVLATSRELLRVPGERTYRVPALSTPDLDTEQTVESVSSFETVRLFIDRAVAVDRSFALTNANAPALAAVCHRLDGIPLAIELAAARSRSMSVGEINDRLDQRFRLLTSGARTVMPRQQTLRSLIDWSYDLLTEPERVVLRRVCVFIGGWSLKAAEQVCSGDGIEDWELLDLLSSLTDKSLVIAEPRADGTRYRLLETVRQYGLELLAANGELTLLRDRHLAYYMAFAASAESELLGPEQGAWLDRLEAEHGNLRSSLELCASSSERLDAEVELCGRLWRFWMVRGYLTEGRDRLRTAIARAEKRIESPDGAKALNAAGHLAWAQGEYRTALDLHRRALEINRVLGNGPQEAMNLNGIALAARELGDFATARESLERALSLNRNLDNRAAMAANMNNLADVNLLLGDREAAKDLFEQSLALNEELGNLAWSVSNLNGLGELAQARGDHNEASCH